MLSVQSRMLWSCRPALMRSSFRPLTEVCRDLFLHVALLSAKKLPLTVLWRPVVPRCLTHHWPWTALRKVMSDRALSHLWASTSVKAVMGLILPILL